MIFMIIPTMKNKNIANSIRIAVDIVTWPPHFRINFSSSNFGGAVFSATKIGSSFSKSEHDKLLPVSSFERRFSCKENLQTVAKAMIY